MAPDGGFQSDLVFAWGIFMHVVCLVVLKSLCKWNKWLKNDIKV